MKRFLILGCVAAIAAATVVAGSALPARADRDRSESREGSKSKADKKREREQRDRERQAERERKRKKGPSSDSVDKQQKLADAIHGEGSSVEELKRQLADVEAKLAALAQRHEAKLAHYREEEAAASGKESQVRKVRKKIEKANAEYAKSRAPMEAQRNDLAARIAAIEQGGGGRQ